MANAGGLGGIGGNGFVRGLGNACGFWGRGGGGEKGTWGCEKK